jgi:hypothetical protein
MGTEETKMRRAACFVLRALLQGKDPESGRPLHQGQVVHRPDVMRALHLGLEALTGGRDQERSGEIDSPRRGTKNKVPDRAGQGWDRSEDEELRTLFGQRRPVAAIAAELGRTRGAISSRLVRLGLVQERGGE